MYSPEFFVQEISKSKFLKSLRIVHLGNEPDAGKKLTKKYGVSNIEFVGKKVDKKLMIF